MVVVSVSMVSDFRPLGGLISIFFWLLATSFSHADQRDIECLRSIKSSLEDPNNYLASWDFDNHTEGFICRFRGVDCWQQVENRVSNIQLADKGLKGEFPLGVTSCSAVSVIDLSSNYIHGNIPNNISKIVFLTSLDLSSNDLSGEIPADLANCSYLNLLRLDNNQLTGQIPPQIGQLRRIIKFSVARNLLIGPVPRFVSSNIPAESYANNPGLCGEPLPPCVGPSKKSRNAAILGGAVGGVTVGALGLAVVMHFISRKGVS